MNALPSFPTTPMVSSSKKLLAAIFASLLFTTSIALAEEGSSGSSPALMNERHGMKAMKTKAVKTFDPACIQAAVLKREDAIIAAMDVFYASKKAAHVARRDALVAAWALPDEASRKAARKAAGLSSEAAIGSARQAWHQARLNAKNAFKTAQKACHAPAESEPETSANPGT